MKQQAEAAGVKRRLYKEKSEQKALESKIKEAMEENQKQIDDLKQLKRRDAQELHGISSASFLEKFSTRLFHPGIKGGSGLDSVRKPQQGLKFFAKNVQIKNLRSQSPGRE